MKRWARDIEVRHDGFMIACTHIYGHRETPLLDAVAAMWQAAPKYPVAIRWHSATIVRDSSSTLDLERRWEVWLALREADEKLALTLLPSQLVARDEILPSTVSDDVFHQLVVLCGFFHVLARYVDSIIEIPYPEAVVELRSDLYVFLADVTVRQNVSTVFVPSLVVIHMRCEMTADEADARSGNIEADEQAALVPEDMASPEGAVARLHPRHEQACSHEDSEEELPEAISAT